MKAGRLVYIFMPVAIVMAFMYAPRAELLGDTSRIIYFHVPLAWVSVLAFVVSGVLSLLYLYGKNGSERLYDLKARGSASIGLAFTVLTVITGSIWAKMSWGSYWNWDPRETSIVILLLIYISYFVLFSAVENRENRGRIGSVYLIFAMVTMPFFIFIVPRVFLSLHPDTILNREGKIHMEASMRLTLLVSSVSFTFLYVYLMGMKNRLLYIDKGIDDLHERRDAGELS